MNFKSIRIILLSTATMLLPVALSAQAEPGNMPDSRTQAGQSPSNQPQPLPSQQPNARPSMQDSGIGNNGQTAQAIKDKMFLRKAAEGGIAQVQFGQLAAQKGSSDEVKALGQQMVTEHTALNKDLEPLADSAGVMLPRHMNKMDQAEYDKLNGLSGDAFDTEYLTMMVKDHHKDLREFRAEAVNTQDPALREAVMKGAKAIHGHLVMIDKLARSKGIEVPMHHGGHQPPPPAQ